MQRQRWTKNGKKLEKNIGMAADESQKQKKRCSKKQGISAEKFILRKNSELARQYQMYKNRVKDDSCAYAVFPEQGSSASQMTADKVMDIISKTTGMRRKSR